MTETTRAATIGQRLSADEVRYVVATAVRAPSVHNTQPWTFQDTTRGIELHADISRRLRASDPSGRELLISCGAALFGARLATQALGRQPIITRWPDPRDATLVAVIRAGGPTDVPDSINRLIRATHRRHSQRFGFSDRPVPPRLLAAMQRDADMHQTQLLLIERPRDRQLLAQLGRKAEALRRHDPWLVAETAAWTPASDARRRDGIPARSYRRSPLRSTLGALPDRDFALGRPQGVPTRDAAHPPVAVGILTTQRDAARDWLSAGEALHHLLLTAAEQWVFAGLHTAALQLPAVREAIRRDLRLHDHPQLLLSLGHGYTAPLTPRRPVDDVLRGQTPAPPNTKENSR